MQGPIIYWMRRDFRLSDNAALSAALATGRPVIPVLLRDPLLAGLAAAPQWRLGQAAAAFARQIEALGSRLILRTGDAATVLGQLARECGAHGVYWERAYDPASIRRDTQVKAHLKAAGLDTRSFPGALLFEPWQVETATGGAYRVFTPFWRAIAGRTVPLPLMPPRGLQPPEKWPASEDLENWQLGRAMAKGAPVVARYACIGEANAQKRLAAFLGEKLEAYRAGRDVPASAATSTLSENLTCGEISPRSVWHGVQHAGDLGAAGGDAFLRQLAWRDFAWHLFYHFPELPTRPWKEEWQAFPWRRNADSPAFHAWKTGRTGYDLVDAGMRELYATGTMHNRVRMVAASFLTKHLMLDWRLGMRWFETCLIDWDAASNAMGWQWVAGCGPDAAPFFRVFNPETQATKFDPGGHYRRRWLTRECPAPQADALGFFQAAPAGWGLRPGMGRPQPVIGLAEGRNAALEAYKSLKASPP